MSDGRCVGGVGLGAGGGGLDLVVADPQPEAEREFGVDAMKLVGAPGRGMRGGPGR